MSLASVLPDSELESAFSCAFRKLQYTTVVNVSAAVEDDLGDTLCRCALGNQLADLLCGFLVSAITAERLFLGGSGCKSHALT